MPEQHADLFYAALAGFGQCGVICRVTLKLIPAPKTVTAFRFAYPDAEALTAAQTVFLEQQSFDHLEDWILPGPQGWLHTIEAAVFHDQQNASAAPPPAQVHCIEQKSLSYLEFLSRPGPTEHFPCLHSTPRHSHPWSVNFLPASSVTQFLQQQLDEEFSPAQMGPMGVIEVYPLRKSSISAPLVRLPEADIVFLVAFFPCSLETDSERLQHTVEMNYQRYIKARALGGSADALIGAIHFNRDDWLAHYGQHWGTFYRAKKTFDPSCLLVSPTAGMWTED